MSLLRPASVALLIALAPLAAACGESAPGATPDVVTQTVTVRADGSPFHPVTDTEWPASSPFAEGGALRIMEGAPTAVGQAAPRVRSVNLYETYAAVIVLDPDRPKQSDLWSWRDGAWSGPIAQGNMDATELAADAFTLDPAAFAVVPQLVERAGRLASDIEDASLSYIGLNRYSLYDDRVVWRVTLSGPRESKTIYFALDGTPLPDP